jgi:hypothetical protein
MTEDAMTEHAMQSLTCVEPSSEVLPLGAEISVTGPEFDLILP